LSSVKMTVPPGTTGTPAISAISGVPAGGAVTLVNNVLTYSFSATFVGASTAASLAFSGLTNTATAGNYTSEIATLATTGPIDAGNTSPTAIAGGTLANPTWSVSAGTTSATGVTYTYGFTTSATATLTSVTL